LSSVHLSVLHFVTSLYSGLCSPQSGFSTDESVDVLHSARQARHGSSRVKFREKEEEVWQIWNLFS